MVVFSLSYEYRSRFISAVFPHSIVYNIFLEIRAETPDVNLDYFSDTEEWVRLW
jgi:hypothetical protein